MSGYKDIHIRIPNQAHAKLKLMSEERDIAQKWIIVDAIEEYFGRRGEAGAEELKKELFEANRRLGSLRSDVEILGELLSFFIFHWLGYTPRLEKAERASLAVEARGRHQKFMEMFVKKLTKGELSLAPALARGVTTPEVQESNSEEEDE